MNKCSNLNSNMKLSMYFTVQKVFIRLAALQYSFNTVKRVMFLIFQSVTDPEVHFDIEAAFMLKL